MSDISLKKKKKKRPTIYPAEGSFKVMAALVGSSFFSAAPREALERLVVRCNVRRIATDEVIIHEGEYEMVCYVTLSGRFRITVSDPTNGEKREVGTMETGEILGEMSVLSGSPRFAEVACVEEGEALVISRDDLLAFFDEAPVVKERVDADYRARALTATLRRLDIFTGVRTELVKELAREVTMEIFQKNERIFTAGDTPDSFYLIRDGFVRLSRTIKRLDTDFFDSRFDKGYGAKKRDPSEFIVAYLGGDTYFGERALLFNRKRSINATAATRVELVRIRKSQFDTLIRKTPGLDAKLREAAAQYADEADRPDVHQQEMLSWVEDHDILVGEKILILDLDRCVRCLHCIDACAALHHDVSRITHNGIRFQNILIPTSCRHCREPTCMIGCPTGAIQRDLQGEVFHTEACIGCGNCARRCPFGNISMVALKPQSGLEKMENTLQEWLDRLRGHTPPEEKSHRPTRKAVKCDMCKGFDYMGCEHNCPTAAIASVSPTDYFTRKRGRGVLL